jgi:hypothetical protein
MIVLTASNVIVNLAAPSIAVWLQSHITQPRPTPETNQPRKQTQRIGGLVRSLRFTLPPLFILFSIYQLHKLMGQTVVTNAFVVNVSIEISLILFNVLSMGFYLVMDLIDRHLSLTEHNIDSTGVVVDMLSTLKKSQPEQKATKKAKSTKNPK